MPAPRSISSPYPIFTDVDGNPLEDGYIYVGGKNLNPEVSPITVYWDQSLTTPAAQPIRTIGGYPSNSGTPARLYSGAEYSITVRNKNMSLVYTSPVPTDVIGIIYSLETVSDLIGYSDALDNSSVTVLGYTAAGDGGGGPFFYDASFARSSADGGIVVDPTVSLALQGTGSGSGCWIRQYSGAVHVKWFGAKGDGVTDDTDAITDTITYALSVTGKVYVPSGTYIVENCIVVNGGISVEYLNLFIQGEGRGTIIKKTTSNTAGALTRLQPARVTGAPGTDVDDYNVDAIFVIVAPDSTNVRVVGFSDMQLTSSAKQSIGIFAPRLALGSFDNMWFDNLNEGMQVRNIFLCNFKNIWFTNSVWGFRHNRTAGDFGGTSCSFDRVSLTDCDHGWEFDNLVYSNMSACSVEHWSVGNYALKAINRTMIAANGLGIEKGFGAGLWIEGSNATSYAASTIGGRTSVIIDSPSFGLGDRDNTLITDFGVATVEDFSVIKRDASLLLTGGLYIQEFNGGVSIQTTLVHDSAAPARIPTITIEEINSFGLTSNDFVVTGGGSKKGVAKIQERGLVRYGKNSAAPMTSNVFAQLRKTANQTFTSGANAVLVFDTPAVYFDNTEGFNPATNGWETNNSGMFKVSCRFQIPNTPVTESIILSVRQGGSTWGSVEVYGTNVATQQIELDCLVPAFNSGEITIEAARGAGTSVTIVGDGNKNQVTIEQV